MGAILALVRARPLDTVLVAAIVATLAYLGWHLSVTDTVLRARASKAEHERDQIEVQHQRAVASALQAEAEQSERIRKQEQEDGKTIAALQVRVRSLEGANAKLRLDLSDSSNQLHDATARYLAEQARRAAADPASASRINGEVSTLFGRLYEETDRIAGESAEAADAAAVKLTVLQDYVRSVCLAPAALDDSVGLTDR